MRKFIVRRDTTVYQDSDDISKQKFSARRSAWHQSLHIDDIAVRFVLRQTKERDKRDMIPYSSFSPEHKQENNIVTMKSSDRDSILLTESDNSTSKINKVCNTEAANY
ncbi:hypothetical protein OUZ56_020050 [Daphnia magna]|uniref:Uncharacterized protein n=1 Tax=Daphnia magna TaxID=35525 RepID=A0ABQ9ZE54_9CRUS|nr:hypothetical protein OUZ56_020050 [Daphnia magna]